jgi:outer membrane protein assembly factor BamA
MLTRQASCRGPRSGVGIFSACLLLPVLLASIFAVARAPVAESARQFKLAGVKVIGSTRHKESEIVRATGLKLGQPITLDALKEAAGKLGTAGVFAELSYRYQTRGDALMAEFTVKDAAQFLPCAFENLVWFSKEELLNGLSSRVPLFDGSVPPGGAMLDAIASALVAMLEERSIHAQVQFTPKGRVGGPIEGLQFRVVGVAIPVRKIEFTGVQKIDRALLQEAARPLMDKDFEASFIKDFANGAIARVYLRQGYLRAQFGDPVPQLMQADEPRNSVLLIIPVTEGEQYRLKGIGWSGESAIPYRDLANNLRLAPGSPVDAVQLEQDVLSLPLLFHPKGYLHADARWEAILDDATHTAAYQIQINQGDLYRLGKLEITGLDDAHVRSLEKLCRLRAGDPYDSTYWNTFFQEIVSYLPPNASGWKVGRQETFHSDAKTVDVRLTFASRASR